MAGRSFVINLLGNSKPAEKAFGRVGKAAGRLPGPVGIATAAITASFAAVIATVGKIGKELVELGEEFNDAYRTIQVGTGAVGSDLEELRQSFRDVAREVPSDFGNIATAIAEVSTRTGLTGDDLSDLSEQFLNLSRLTGGDVTADIRGATRMFNRFGVDAEDTGDMLDFLFRVSQATGIGIEKLGKNTTDYGAQLQNMGLSLEEAVVFMGLLEREGASVTRIMPSLNTAAMKLKAEGFDNVNEGLAFFIDELRTLDDDAAESRAMEILGSQYKNFLDVVRDNNIDYGELVERLQDSNVTINETAEETDGVREAWEEFKNYLKLQFEGPALAVFEGLKETIEGLIPAADRVKEAYEEGGITGALEQVADEWDKIYEERLQPLWERFLQFLNDYIKPLALELGEQIGGAIASGMWNAFKSGVSNLFGPKFGDRVLSDLEATGEFNMEVDLTPWNDLDVLNLPSMGGGPPAPGGGGGPGGDRRPPPPRPDPTPPRGGSSAPGRSVEYAPGLFAYVPFAEGGIVTGPTLGLVGEAGPEAIIPLDRAGGMGQTVINVTVTSADPQAVVEAIRRYTRNNGPLSQVVSV